MVIRDHIFLLLSVIVRIIHLGNKMATHGLSTNKIWLIIVIDHKKMPRWKELVVKDLGFLLKAN
jgi:hypothetical protein